MVTIYLILTSYTIPVLILMPILISIYFPVPLHPLIPLSLNLDNIIYQINK